MTGEFGAAGEIVGGGLLARAVEPGAGEHGAQGNGGAGGLCLNCGTQRVGGFCHHCGQPGHVHRTVGSIVHDVLHGVLHFDGKTWRTLPMLAFRPGELTRRYIAGERARFVSPMAIFLFSVVLMFAIVAQLPGWNFGQSDWMKPGLGEGIVRARTALAGEQARAEQAIVAEQRLLARARAKTEPDREQIARLEKRLADAKRARAEIAKVTNSLATPEALATETAHARAGEPTGTGFTDGMRDGWNAAGKRPANPNETWAQAKWEHAKANPQLLLYKVKTSAYKFSWALIPLSLPLVWLLFAFRRDVGLYDHAIFATYSLGFMSLLVIALAVLGAIGMWPGLVWTAVLLIPPLHIYKQLKYAYRLRRANALVRTVLMVGIALLTLSFFAAFLLWLGLLD